MSEERQEKQQKKLAELSDIAYKKIIYHILRYPSSKVFGLLAGESINKITNAYPLFHSPIVNPTLGVAMDLVESNLQKGQKIIGFYEFVEGGQPKIVSIVQNNLKLKQMLIMRVWMNSQKRIKFGSASYNFSHPDFETLSPNLKKGDYRLIVDFDAHLEEIELDFRNNYVK